MSTKPALLTVECLAAAILAFEQNRHVSFSHFTNSSNKEWIKTYLLSDRSAEKFTSAQIEQASKVISYLTQKATFLALTTNCNPFVKAIAETLDKSHCSISDIGTIAWAPKVYNDFVSRDQFKENLNNYINSQYVGAIKDKLIFNATILNQQYIKKLGTWAVTICDDKNNLYSFFTNELSKVKNGQVSGRVRGHRKCPFHNNLAITNLHYVKFL